MSETSLTPVATPDPSAMATLADGRTIPFDWDSDPAVLRLNGSASSGARWQYAAAPTRSPSRARDFAADAGGVPVVVVRDLDAALRAFVKRFLPAPPACLRKAREALGDAASAPTTAGPTTSTARCVPLRAPDREPGFHRR